MAKRKRRTAREIQRLRDDFLKAIQKEGKITLTNLIQQYGAPLGVKNTPSDKNLVKRQLDRLVKEGLIQFRRQGRDLVAQADGKGETPKARPKTGKPAAKKTAEAAPAAARPAASSRPADLEVIRAYARQLEEFSRTLQDHIRTLVRMVEKAGR